MAFILIISFLLGLGVTALYLAVSFRGPYLVNKLVPGCSVKSVSLRSIRGFRITRGAHAIEIDRIGLSFGRQPNASGWLAFRCSIQVSDVTCRLFEGSLDTPKKPVLQLKKPPAPKDVHSLRSRRSRFSIQNFALFTNPTNDTVAPPLTILKRIAPSLARNIDSLLRPVFRILFVAAFRIVIRFLPTLMQAVEFELKHANLTVPKAQDFTLSVERVRVSTQVKFTQLERVIDDSTPEDADTPALRRLSRMGNWRFRLKGSWDRTWNRAWGRTHVFSGVSINVGRTGGTIRPSTSSGDAGTTITLSPAIPVFSIDGPCWLKGSVNFIPGRATFERQSMDLAASLGALLVDVDNIVLSARKISEVLGPKRTSQGASPSPMDAIAEEPISPLLSPTMSPLLSPTTTALVLQYRRRFRERARKRGTLNFTEVFKGIDFRLPTLEFVAGGSTVTTGDVPNRLRFSIKDVFLKGEVSNPEVHELHRKWLGKSALGGKAEALAFNAGFGTTSLGWIASSGHGVVPLLTLDSFALSALTTVWPESHRMNPNECLLVIEAKVDPLVVSSTMKDVYALKALAANFQSPPSTRPVPTRSPIMHIPRLIVDIQTGGFNFLFCLDGHGSQSPTLAGLHLRVPHIGIQGRSEFVARPWSRRDHSRQPYTESLNLVDSPYALQFDITGSAGPVDLQAIFEDRVPKSQPGRHSIVRLSQVDLHVDGDILAALPDGASKACIDSQTVLAHLRCISDTFAVDLTNPEALSIIPDILSAIPPSDIEPPQSQPPSEKPLLANLPAGICTHFAIATISCLASGRDLAPGNVKLVKRGIELRTGVSVGYSSMHDRIHSSRTRSERFASDRLREELAGPNDILSESVSISHELRQNLGEQGALARLDVFNLQARPIVDYGAAFVPLCDWEPKLRDKEPTTPTALLYIPVIRVDILLKRTTASQPGLYHDSCRVVAHVPRVRLNLSVHHAYCLLLSSTALLRLRSSSPSSSSSRPKPTSPSKHDFVVQVTGHVEHIEAHVDLPGTQKVYLRLDKLKLVIREPHHEVSFALLHGWVRSEDGKWDEMLRLRHFELVAPPDESERISIIAQGARLRIPHEYSLASLIQEISLSVKTIKHLAHIARVGHFVAMETPPAEDAKRVPPLVIAINALVIEAVDDPFETKLSLLWRAGFKEQQERLIREEAFAAKLQAIEMEIMDDSGQASHSTGSREWHFTNRHTVDGVEAYRRLQQFNSSAWFEAFANGKKALTKHEETQLRYIGQIPGSLEHKPGIPLDIRPAEVVPPLIRLLFDGVRVELAQPTFGETGSSLPEFLKRTGELPLDTEYTLLVPLNIRWEMRYALVTLRDYPIPLLHVRPNQDQAPSWTATADLVIAEEIGPNDSVEWLPTTVVPEGLGVPEQVGFSILVPKTGMPVKTYANPEVHVTSSFATDISWGVSYQPCVADVMRIVDSLTHPSRDPSTPLGFWDKMRLSLHGKLRISFVAGLNLLIKGEDPYEISGNGAGFALSWSGHPEITMGYYPEEKELVQFRGERMVLGIPNLPTFADHRLGSTSATGVSATGGHQSQMQKICAKLTNGVKLGLGFALERKCGSDCTIRHTMDDSCRLFTFRPHYEVKLRPSTADPEIDSFAGFRSNFIHFSVSLISPSNSSLSKTGYNSFHLSPKAFAHFFSWWHVFNPPNGPMLLPIRQGSLYPSDKPPPLKFTRHLVTLKYRFSLSPLFISHVYRQDSRTSWATGITPCVGIKAMVETFQADLHQRDEIELIKNEVTGDSKKKAHKPFYAAEVAAKGLDLRAMLARFREPEKPAVDLPPLPSGDFETSSSARPPLPASSKEPMHSRWVDLDDFVETDWTPEDSNPALWLFTVASCPRITYFKKPEHPITHGPAHTTCSIPEKSSSPFGNENTHICLMGTEDSTIQVQAALCSQRLKVLEEELSDVLSFQEDVKISTSNRQGKKEDEVLQTRQQALEKKIELLREHLESLENLEVHQAHRAMNDEARISTGSLPYDYPTQDRDGIDWSQFDNIYQIHCPQVHLNNYTRNIILDYYYSSRHRRGFEYHLSERAVRFIREQSPSLASKLPRMSQDSENGPTPRNRAQAAAHTIRKIFTADGGSRDSAPQVIDVPQPIKCQAQGEIEPASGWKTEDIIVNKSHMCLLLNPQFTLRSTADDDSILVITVGYASLQTFAILDKHFVDGLTADPINANIMKRNYGSLKGLQIFSPSHDRDRSVNATPYEVPLEVLLDRRCESSDFDRLVPQTDATLQYDKFNRLRLRNKVTSATNATAEDSDINNHLQAQNDRIILNVDQLAVSANAQNFGAIYNIVSDLLLYMDPDQRERNRQLQTFMYSYDFKDFMASANVVSDLQTRLRALLDDEVQLALSPKKELADNRLINRAHIFLLAEELNLIFKAIRLVQEQDENSTDETKSNMRFDAFVKEVSWKMLETTDDTLAKLTVRGIEYAWHSQKDSSAAHKLVINDLQALDSSPDAIFPEMLIKFDKASSHPMVAKSLFAQAEWSILAPVGGIPIVNSFVLDLHPIRLQFERKLGRKILSYIFSRREALVEANGKPSATSNPTRPSRPSTPRTSYSATVGPGHKSRSSVGTIAGVGLGIGSGIAGIPRASLDNTSLESASEARPRTLKKRATSHTDLQEAAAASSPAIVGDDLGLEGRRPIPRSRSSNALRTEAKRPGTPSKGASRTAVTRPTTGDKDKERERERELEAKDDANEMRVRASKNRTFVYVKVSGLALALSYKRDTPMSLTTVPDLDDFRFETPAFAYQNETWSFEDMLETLRKDIYRAAWAQKGALLREIFTKAKIITPKRFLPHEKWMHKRPKDKTAKQALPSPEIEKEPLDSPVDQDLMVASDSGLALFHRHEPSPDTRPQRPSLPENGSPIGFPSDQEPSPTPNSISSSREGSSYAFPASADSEGRPSTTSRSGRSTSIDWGGRRSRDGQAPALSFPSPPSPPPVSVRSGHTGSHRPTRERVLSLFKKKKKDSPVDDGTPRRTLDVPEVPPLPPSVSNPRQRTISANAKMQQQFQ
ncbi:RNA pol II promoter Fmp27 protein domain [Rhizoctonia solani]|uniref:RNA pol II promoter Fmp27 protein domain n=2 Tax=Rhizoctonia solani TaxID=456999 RepID=A0A8H7H9T6_9AGAM|nr:RNA pol II promoter Fmp27 protein domain [Rhizoctonia solani]